MAYTCISKSKLIYPLMSSQCWATEIQSYHELSHAIFNLNLFYLQSGSVEDFYNVNYMKMLIISF